jgi:hypothetical protein
LHARLLQRLDDDVGDLFLAHGILREVASAGITKPAQTLIECAAAKIRGEDQAAGGRAHNAKRPPRWVAGALIKTEEYGGS